MPGQNQKVIERQKRLVAALRVFTTDWLHCHSIQRLQAIIPDEYPNNPAGRRKLQRDLQYLEQAEAIESQRINPQDWRYRRARHELADDALIRDGELQNLRARLLDAVRESRLAAALTRELSAPTIDFVGRDLFRVVPDHLQLREVSLSPVVVDAVLEGLLEQRPINAHYRKRSGEAGAGVLHPQGLIQRGPLPYLLAIKEDNPELVKQFPLHRMDRATVLANQQSRILPEFDLQGYLEEGRGDFGQGDHVRIRVRVRGYIKDIIEACPLADDQQIDKEPEGSAFDAMVTATLPSTGNLLRWLLAAGANLEVVEPMDLRQRVATQVAACQRFYEPDWQGNH